jgi:hypothetical protein
VWRWASCIVENEKLIDILESRRSTHPCLSGLSSAFLQRPFACNWQNCEKGFTKSYDLQRHMRVHTMERPYACTYGDCTVRFSQSSHLQKHLKTHERNAVCAGSHVTGCARRSYYNCYYFAMAHRYVSQLKKGLSRNCSE